MERVMPTKCHDVWHPLFFRLKTWTMGFAVTSVLFQVVIDLTFHFVDPLDLERREKLDRKSVV